MDCKSAQLWWDRKDKKGYRWKSWRWEAPIWVKTCIICWFLSNLSPTLCKFLTPLEYQSHPCSAFTLKVGTRKWEIMTWGMGVGLLLYSEMCFSHTHFPSDICFPEFLLAVTIFKASMICRIMIVTELKVKACLCFIQASQEWKRTHMQSCICILCYIEIISTMKYLTSLYHTSPMQKWLSRDVTKQYHWFF